jgi:acetoin utilization deacetylase AcuC-like enzyme
MVSVRHGPLHALVRAARRSYYRLRARGLPLVFDDRYRHGLPGVPMDPLRGEKILSAVREAGLLDPSLLSEPRPASLQNLLRVHTPEYLQSVQEPATLTRIVGSEVAAREVEATLDQQRLMTGGTIQATRLAMRTGGIVVHLGGGFHHAAADAGLGFCVFNDVAVAVKRLRARGFVEPVLVVDLDLHDGNGTRSIFAEDPTVHTFSIHNEHWGDTDAVASTSLALGAEVDDARYLATLKRALPPVVEAVQPGLVIYVAGTDPAHDDVVGNWRLSAAGLAERDRFVTALARRGARPVPLVVLLAGGYGPHAWSYTARYVLELAAGRPLEPPDEDLSSLARVRALRTARPAADDELAFTLSEEDLASLVPGAARPARFLSLYSRHGVELMLERAQIMGALRARGFRRLRVDLDGLDHEQATVRVSCEDRGDERLLELRARRSRSVLPGLELVAIDWLLLQNPREAFTPRRPRLPGQQHPGLGLLKDLMSWLVVECETHGLDGVYFVCAHYHVAVQSRRLVRPVDPHDEARLRALAEALAGLSLPEATLAVDTGRVVDARGEPLVWTPVASVLPVSETLRERVSGPEYEAAAARRAAELELRLRPAADAPDRPPGGVEFSR